MTTRDEEGERVGGLRAGKGKGMATAASVYPISSTPACPSFAPQRQWGRRILPSPSPLPRSTSGRLHRRNRQSQPSAAPACSTSRPRRATSYLRSPSVSTVASALSSHRPRLLARHPQLPPSPPTAVLGALPLGLALAPGRRCSLLCSPRERSKEGRREKKSADKWAPLVCICFFLTVSPRVCYIG